MNISNYALILEKKTHGYLQINEAADMQTADGLAKLISGASGGSYVNQWNQLMTDLKSKKGAPGTYQVMIKHDGNKKDMIYVEYTIGADGKPVKGSTKLATEPAGSGKSGNWDANKFLSFNANGKLHEVVSAMIHVCLEKLGDDWGSNHVQWVVDNLNKAANGNTTCTGLNRGTYGGLVKSLNFLQTDGTVRKYALACDDAPLQIKNAENLKNAGDAKDQNALDSVISAIKTKLDESITSIADENSMISCYEFISPKITQEMIEATWKKLGMSAGGPLSAIVNEKDTRNDAWGKALGTWALGSRKGNANQQAIQACGLDKSAHDAAVVAIRGVFS